MEKACRFFMVFGFIAMILSAVLAIYDYVNYKSLYPDILIHGRATLYGLVSLLIFGVAAILYATRKR